MGKNNITNYFSAAHFLQGKINIRKHQTRLKSARKKKPPRNPLQAEIVQSWDGGGEVIGEKKVLGDHGRGEAGSRVRDVHAKGS